MNARTSFAVATAFLLVTALVVGSVVLGEIAVHPPRHPVSRASLGRLSQQGQLAAAVEDVQIVAADGAVLAGTYATPHHENGNLVILLHGVSDNRNGVLGFAQLLLEQGYRVLLPDSRAQGDSGGRFASYGVLERDDVHRWADFAEGKQPIHCIYGFGESMGAAILLQSIAHDRRFCAAVAESGFSTFQEAGYERLGRFAHTGPWLGRTLLRPLVEGSEKYVRWKYKVDLRSANPSEAVTNSCTPILLIHGQADRNLLPSNSEVIHEAAEGHSVLWRVAGAAHCGASSVEPQEFRRKVLEWFSEHNQPCSG